MSERTGRGAVAVIVGLVCLSIVAVVVVAWVFVAITGDNTSVFDLQTGDCFVLPIEGDETSLGQVETVACTDAHDAEVVLTGELNSDQDREYPSDDDVLFAEIDAHCAAIALPGRFGMLPIAPDEGSWQPLGGRYLCVAVPLGGGMVNQPVSRF